MSNISPSDSPRPAPEPTPGKPIDEEFWSQAFDSGRRFRLGEYTPAVKGERPPIPDSVRAGEYTPAEQETPKGNL